MKSVKTLLATAMMAAALPAMAYEAGDMMVKVGAVQVMPKSDNGTHPLGEIDVQDNTQLGLNFTYMLSKHIGLEVLAATPFEHDVEVGNLGVVATTKHLPPTVSVQYYPLSDSATKWQPYVGVGVNYTTFFDESGAAESLSDSWGWSVSAGLNYDINEKWLLNAAVWKMSIESELNGAVDVEIDPVVFFVGAGYKF